jgi:hypothetical protein
LAGTLLSVLRDGGSPCRPSNVVGCPMGISASCSHHVVWNAFKRLGVRFSAAAGIPEMQVSWKHVESVEPGAGVEPATY